MKQLQMLNTNISVKKFTVLLLCIVLSLPLLAQNKKLSLSDIMQTYHNYNMFDGAVLVAENGKIIYKGALGFANREWSIQNRTDTKFMIGSVSKPLTATLVLLQVQKGLLDLNKTIADYLPEFKTKPAAGVTIKQLLSHTSGVPNYDLIKDFFPRISRQSFTREEYVKVYMDSALSFKPGERYSYSSWGYYTLDILWKELQGSRMRN
jgi:CubicO group peptidase (beta-lactamase class C family)